MSSNRKFVFSPLRGAALAAALLMGAACHASTLISEVFYDASGADKGLVFVELFGAPGTLLDGLWLEGVNGQDGAVYRRVDLAGAIPADGIFVVGDDIGDGTSLVAGADLVAAVDFQNGPDSVVLRDAASVLDALAYGDFMTAVFAGEGHAAMAAATGHSLARIDPRLDSDDNRADFTSLASPSPGRLESIALPLPPAVVLFVSGIAGLLGAGLRARS